MGEERHGSIVALIGNGVSLAYNGDLGCNQLAATLRSGLIGPLGARGVGELDRVGTALLADGQIGNGSFEGLLGPLDRLGDALRGLERLSSIAGARPLLDFCYKKVRAHIQHLYRTGVAVVLTRIAMESKKDTSSPNWGRYCEFPDWLIRVTGARVLQCFTLNYDSLLDAYFLGKSIGNSDQADGRAASHTLKLADGPLSVIPLRPPGEADYCPDVPWVVSHHLHGSIQWVREGSDIYKVAKLDEVRNRSLFRKGIDPVVVLTDRKSQIIDQWPFVESYGKLAKELRRADGIVIAGYGFGDVPVNVVLRDAFEYHYNNFTNTKIAIIASKSLDEILDALAPETTHSHVRNYLYGSTGLLTLVNSHLPAAVQAGPLESWNP